MAKGGKIKNWSRKSRTSNHYEWRHDDGNGKIIVKDHVAGDVKSGVSKTGKYAIKYKSKKGFSKEVKTGPGLRSKEKARKRAVKWMRKHPNPPKGVI